MFFYLERLLALDDVELDPEFCKHILDLYCDIVMLNTGDVVQ